MARGGLGRGAVVAVCVLVVVAAVAVVRRADVAQASAGAETAVVARVQTPTHVVALTFDDGPSAEWTPIVQEQLMQAHVPATFFLIGHDAARRPDLVRTELASGHEVGDHTYFHPRLTGLSAVKVRLEIRRGAAAIAGAGGARPRLFRPPYGKTNAAIDAMVRDEGMRTVLWDLSLEHYVDHQPVPKGVAKLVDAVRPGAIILAHDGGKSDRSRTLEALPLLIRALRARGYRFVTVSQLLNDGTAEANRA